MKYSFGLLLFSLFFNSNRLLSQCLKAGAGDSYATGITKSSGNSNVDNQIRNFVEKINGIFGTSAEFAFYDDSEGSNAYASREDRNIYIGLNFLSQTLNSRAGMTGVAFLLGHELAHVYQFNTEEDNKFMTEDLVKNAELQADFLAAYAISKLGLINSSNYQLMLSQAMDVGDIFFKDQTHHGTPSERKASAIWGFYKRDVSLADAYDQSYTYCCPKDEDMNKLVYTLNLNNGMRYYIIYGGALCKKGYNGEYQKIAQMVSTGNIDVPFTFEFSKNDPSRNLFMNNNNQLLDYSGNIVGYAVKNNETPRTKSQETPSSTEYPSTTKDYTTEYNYPILMKQKLSMPDIAGKWDDLSKKEFEIEIASSSSINIKHQSFTFTCNYSGVDKDNYYVFKGYATGSNLHKICDFSLDKNLLSTSSKTAKELATSFKPASIPIQVTVDKNGSFVTIYCPKFEIREGLNFIIVDFSDWADINIGYLQPSKSEGYLKPTRKDN